MRLVTISPGHRCSRAGSFTEHRSVIFNIEFHSGNCYVRDYATVSGYIIVMNEHYHGHGNYYAGV